MRLKLEDVCCVAVDYQEKFMPVIAKYGELLEKSVKLLEGMQILEVPVVVTTQYAKGLGATVPEIVQAAGTEEAFDKKSFSVYGDAAVRGHLRALGKKQILLCGIEAHICVFQSALDLLEAGYRRFLWRTVSVQDGCMTRQIAMERARAEGMTVTTYEALLFELMRSAEHEKFRLISGLVK